MALSPFADRSRPPREADLAGVLGAAAKPWRDLRAAVMQACAPIEPEWRFTSASTGWGLRLKHGKRVLLYMTPGEGCFLASFALGEKAVEAARAAKLPARVLAVVDAAPRYAEGRGVRFEVRSGALVGAIARLVAIKHAH
jgi:hypothetical protein